MQPMSLGPRPKCSVPSGILIHPAVWPQQTLAENWGLCPIVGGRGGLPCETMWPGPRPTSVASGILIQPAIWRTILQNYWSSKTDSVTPISDQPQICYLSKNPTPTSGPLGLGLQLLLQRQPPPPVNACHFHGSPLF